MAKRDPRNERLKRDYILFLEETKGLDEKSTDKVLAAILKFEQSTGFKPFSRFHIEQAVRFKADLAKAKNPRTGKPLSHSTVDATLALVRDFFIWLSGQSGYRSKLSYSDTAYFKNNRKNARIAHTQRELPYPSMQAALQAFKAMPEDTETQKRNKAIFAFLMLTGARIGAVASLKLKHIDMEEGYVFQDAREVATKNAKTIDTWFLPVEDVYMDCFTAWVTYLRDKLLFGPADALFPKSKVGIKPGQGFANLGLSREGYSGTSQLNAIVRGAFAAIGLPEYTPHCLRKTLVLYGDEVCESLEEMKAWSINLGHEHLATTINAYLPVSKQRQREIIRQIKGKQ